MKKYKLESILEIAKHFTPIVTLAAVGISGQCSVNADEKNAKDYTQYTQPHKWDFSSGLGGWSDTSRTVKISYGSAIWGGPYGLTKTGWSWVKSKIVTVPPFVAAKDSSGSTVLQWQTPKPFVPKETPDIDDVGSMSIQLTSPFFDLTVNKDDKLVIESRGHFDHVYLYYYDVAGEEFVQRPTLDSVTDSGEFKESIYNLEQSRNVQGNPVRIKQTRKAKIVLVRYYPNELLRVGKERALIQIRKLVTPPLYDESFKPLRFSERLDFGRDDKNIPTVRWRQGVGVLECAPSPNGPWERVKDASNPYTLSSDQGMKFFRLRARVEGD